MAYRYKKDDVKFVEVDPRIVVEKDFVKTKPNKKEKTQFIYLHKYLFGGATTFTSHLVHRLGVFDESKNTNQSNSASDMPYENTILRCTKITENKRRDFGYGLHYQNIPASLLARIRYPFLTIFKENYFPVLLELNKRSKDRLKDITLVIHDHRDISYRIAPYVKNWRIIAIRRTVQEYIQKTYGLDCTFLYHPFYPYPVICKPKRKGAISISRISFEKNIDVILRANKMLDTDKAIKLYGCPSRVYVHNFLGGFGGDFNKYYYGLFEKSFSRLSEILADTKFVIDLSILKHDGGGTQYTFLEAIHNDCALILHKKWIEGGDIGPEYSDFKDGYNCFAVENEVELAELIRRDPDTSKVVANSKALIQRHINVDWSPLLKGAPYR